MGFKALTVNTPVEQEAHILAEDDAALYGSVVGGDCVLPIGSRFQATATSSNNVRIGDGVLIVGGHVGRIVKYDYEDMAIANGVSGQNRNDLIVARFISGGTAGVDKFRLVVVQGTPGAAAKDPATVQGDLYAGDAQRDYPLWRVRIVGLGIAGVDKMYTVGMALKQLEADKLDKTGNASNVTNTFTQAASRENIASGEKLSVSFGKIMKWFADINSALFGNKIKTADGKAEMKSDAEGGNFLLISPEGVRWEVDAHDENLRIFNYETLKSLVISKEGSVQAGTTFYADDVNLRDKNIWVSSALDSKLPKANVINNLTTTASGYALDARQGKVLNDKKFDKSNVINNLTTTASGYALDARQGRALNNALLRYIQINVTLTQTFNFTAWEISTVFWGSITSYLPSGAVIAGAIYCAAGSGNFASTNTQITSTAENKVNVTLCNMTSGSVNISSIRLGVWYHY